MPEPHSDTDQLLKQTVAGDQAAAQELLSRCRPRLHRMIALHLDQRVSARLDPSDVVQETMAEAFQRLPEYIREPAISFYPWLRRIAWQRLIKLHRTHLTAARRTVRREDVLQLPLLDDSVNQLAHQLSASGTEPGRRMVREEMRARVRLAIDELRPEDRELLAMRYLEHMSLKEIAEAADVSLGSIRKRHTRALERLERVLRDLI